MVNIWHEQTTVKTYEIDFQQRWKLACFFQAMQEAASHHAANLGFAHHDLMANNMTWILSRVRLRIQAYPHMGDEVHIETWPKGIQQRLFFMRDFYLRDAAGDLLAEASTAWVLVNPSARRILAPAALSGDLPDNAGRAALPEPLEKLVPPPGLPERLAPVAHYSDVDQIGHVSNVRYIEWISNALTFDEHRAMELREIQINYTNEVKPGEQIRLCLGPDPAGSPLWWAQGLHAGDTSAFEARFSFSSL